MGRVVRVPLEIILYENQTDLLGDYMHSLAGPVNTIERCPCFTFFLQSVERAST